MWCLKCFDWQSWLDRFHHYSQENRSCYYKLRTNSLYNNSLSAGKILKVIIPRHQFVWDISQPYKLTTHFHSTPMKGNNVLLYTTIKESSISTRTSAPLFLLPPPPNCTPRHTLNRSLGTSLNRQFRGSDWLQISCQNRSSFQKGQKSRLTRHSWWGLWKLCQSGWEPLLDKSGGSRRKGLRSYLSIKLIQPLRWCSDGDMRSGWGHSRKCQWRGCGKGNGLQELFGFHLYQ